MEMRKTDLCHHKDKEWALVLLHHAETSCIWRDKRAGEGELWRSFRNIARDCKSLLTTRNISDSIKSLWQWQNFISSFNQIDKYCHKSAVCSLATLWYGEPYSSEGHSSGIYWDALKATLRFREVYWWSSLQNHSQKLFIFHNSKANVLCEVKSIL